MTQKINLAKWHGVLLITLFALAAFLIGDMDWCKAVSFSPMIVGILLGMVYANTLRPQMPEAWAPGVKFCSKRILRTGIILAFILFLWLIIGGWLLAKFLVPLF